MPSEPPHSLVSQRPIPPTPLHLIAHVTTRPLPSSRVVFLCSGADHTSQKNNRCRPINQKKQVNSETQRLPVEPETTPVTRTTDRQHTSRPSPITQCPQSPFPSSSLYPIPISGREPLLHQTDQARYQKFSPQLGQRPPSGSGVMPVSRNPDDRPETKEQNAHPTKTN